MRVLYLLGWGYVAVVGALLYRGTHPERFAAPPHAVAQHFGSEAGRWFAGIRSNCNSLEVQLAITNNPPPDGTEGAGYAAACYALAGRMSAARARIDALPQDDRYTAAGIVFEVGHPVADAGDDESAGPLMELVIDYWPNHYMALYHAGMAQYRLEQFDLARKNLEAFLREYKSDDGWTTSARQTLADMKR